MPFLDDDFLLTNETACKLYQDTAAHQPIYDYHTHLSPADIASNRVFETLYDIWLEGDHYKWRAMRADGVDEELITGDADPYDKFVAWAKTVPATLRNPLYHWTHLELRRYFGIDLLLSEHTAKEIWDEANRQLKDLSTHAIFEKFKVALVGTTDDPTDTLEHHAAIAALGIDTKVVPTYRPDKAMAVSDPGAFVAYCQQLGEAAGRTIESGEDLLQALTARHATFHEAGARASDHGLLALPGVGCDANTFKKLSFKAINGHPLENPEQDRVVSFLMAHVGQLNHHLGWVMQLHLGPIRNVNVGLFNEKGPDIGCDSMGDAPQAAGLQQLLGGLSSGGALPKTILYNLNPVNNYLFATMAGNFQGGGIPGKVQFGSGWWFLDQKDGMTWQLNALSNLGLLSRFVGMLTDSRSMMSYPRHEYFRRILCNLIGTDVENGELPDDEAMLTQLVADVCFNNARDYFGIELSETYA